MPSDGKGSAATEGEPPGAKVAATPWRPGRTCPLTWQGGLKALRQAQLPKCGLAYSHLCKQNDISSTRDHFSAVSRPTSEKVHHLARLAHSRESPLRGASRSVSCNALQEPWWKMSKIEEAFFRSTGYVAGVLRLTDQKPDDQNHILDVESNINRLNDEPKGSFSLSRQSSYRRRYH
jgi:hypothetical protein